LPCSFLWRRVAAQFIEGLRSVGIRLGVVVGNLDVHARIGAVNQGLDKLVAQSRRQPEVVNSDVQGLLGLLAETSDQRGDGGRLARRSAMIDVLQKRNIDLALRVSPRAGARS
jgi:hypothetical protein